MVIDVVSISRCGWMILARKETVMGDGAHVSGLKYTPGTWAAGSAKTCIP